MLFNKNLKWGLIVTLPLLLLLLMLCDSPAMDKPTVNTVEAATQAGSVSLKGRVEATRGEISEYGFNWGTSKALGKKAILSSGFNLNKAFTTTISGLQAGTTYYYQAYAVNSGGTGLGEIKSFSLKKNARPSVSISRPADNFQVIQGEVLYISASATDDEKIESMELSINDVLKRSARTESISYSWDTSQVDPGKYTIKVSAGDGEQVGKKAIAVLVKSPQAATARANASSISTGNSPAAGSAKTSKYPTVASRSASSTDRSKYPRVSKVNGSFGSFYYRDTSGGRIEIDPNWIAANIVTIKLPGLNKYVQVNKAAADNFIYAFSLIKNGTAVINGRQVPLLSLVKTMDGTFVTRHVNWNPGRGLSNHSWGTAIDINASDHFRYVDPSREKNDPNLILWEKAFKPAGFSWGNSYSDSMHFELLK